MDLNPPGALDRSQLSSSSLNPAVVSGSGTTPANVDNMYVYASVPAQPVAAAPGGDDGSSSSRPPRRTWPELELDSGASFHVVGDPTLLSNLRDAPAGLSVMVADGNRLPITKVGDITMIAGFRIPGVLLAPGLKCDLISIRELARNRICTFFDGDRAMLYEGPELVGQAVASEDRYGLYVLKFLSVTTATAGNCSLDGQIEFVPVWRGSSARGCFGSVVCRLKALLRRRLFSAGWAKNPMWESRDRYRTHREGKREKEQNSRRKR